MLRVSFGLRGLEKIGGGIIVKKEGDCKLKAVLTQDYHHPHLMYILFVI